MYAGWGRQPKEEGKGRGRRNTTIQKTDHRDKLGARDVDLAIKGKGGRYAVVRYLYPSPLGNW